MDVFLTSVFPAVVTSHWTEGYVDTRINDYSRQIAENWIIWFGCFNARLARSSLPSIKMATRKCDQCDDDIILLKDVVSFSVPQTHFSPHSVSQRLSVCCRVCRQKVTFDPTPLCRTISPSSVLYSSPCLINVIPVRRSINLYETGAQWLAKTNQSCWTAPLLNSRSLAGPEETEKYGLEGKEKGCLCPFFFYHMQKSAAAATVGSPVGKILAALWSGVEPPITINRRKRPVTVHKGEKRHNNWQRLKGGRDGGKDRGNRERDTTRGAEGRTKGWIKERSN